MAGPIDDAFRADGGLSLNDETLINFTTVDPTTGGGYEAPIGSLLLYKPVSGEGELFKKYSSSNTDWKKFSTKAAMDASVPNANNDSVDTAGFGRTFDEGDIWVHTGTNVAYICTDNTPTAAVWSLASTIFPGNALEDVGGTFNVKVDGSTIQINGSNQLEINTAGNLLGAPLPYYFGKNNANVQDEYLNIVNNIPSNQTGYRAIRNGTIRGIAWQSEDTGSVAGFIRVRVNGSNAASLAIVAAQQGNQDTSYNVDFNAGDILSCYIEAGSVRKPSVVVEYVWRA